MAFDLKVGQLSFSNKNADLARVKSFDAD